jgi:hypothetical protein
MNIIKLDDGVNERGFFSVILQMVSIKILNTNIPFYIDLSNWKLYQNNPNDNVWNYYFEQFYNDFNTNDRIMNRNTLVNYVDRFKALLVMRNQMKSLKIKQHILDKIAKYDSYFDGKKVLGVHKRGTDSDEHRPIVPIEEYYRHIDQELKNYDYLYVCGDEQFAIDDFKKRYKDKIFVYDDAFRSDSKKPIHKFFNDKCEPYKKGEDVIIDAVLLSKCNNLILTDSNVAFFSIYFNNNMFKFIDNTKLV